MKQVSDKNRNIRTQIVAPCENSVVELSGQKIWPSNGCFKSQVTDYIMEKVNYPENSIFTLTRLLTVQKSKKMYYADRLISGQVIEAANVTQDIDSYQCAENEVKIYRPKYDISTGQFLGLYETVGLIIVRGDDDEVFFNYGFDKDKSKVLYSYQKGKIINSFSGTTLNCHKDMIESGELESEYSNLFFFFYRALHYRQI